MYTGILPCVVILHIYIYICICIYIYICMYIYTLSHMGLKCLRAGRFMCERTGDCYCLSTYMRICRHLFVPHVCMYVKCKCKYNCKCKYVSK